MAISTTLANTPSEPGARSLAENSLKMAELESIGVDPDRIPPTFGVTEMFRPGSLMAICIFTMSSCPPRQVKLYLIDFALASKRGGGGESGESGESGEWGRRCESDLAETYRQALWVQSGLGRQNDEPGPSSVEKAAELLPASHRACLEKIDRHSLL